MILSYSTIVQYIINQFSWKEKSERGNKTIDNFFVTGAYTIREDAGSVNPSRNRCFSIENNNFSGEGMNYYLKQPKNFTRENIISIIREQSFYEIIKNEQKIFQKITPYLPKLYDFNSKDYIVILEWISNSQSFRDFQKTSLDEKVRLNLIKKSGKILRLFHDSLRNNSELFKASKPLFFDTFPLTLLEIDIDTLAFQKRFRFDLKTLINSMGNTDLEFNEIINQSLKYWHEDSNKTIIHGDFKAGNILIKQTNSLYFIDWEYALWGSPEFDLASYYYDELVDNDFKVDDILMKDFKALAEGYYHSGECNKEILKKITIFCKARLVDYWCKTMPSITFITKDGNDDKLKIGRLMKLIDLIVNLDITI